MELTGAAAARRLALHLRAALLQRYSRAQVVEGDAIAPIVFALRGDWGEERAAVAESLSSTWAMEAARPRKNELQFRFSGL